MYRTIHSSYSSRWPIDQMSKYSFTYSYILIADGYTYRTVLTPGIYSIVLYMYNTLPYTVVREDTFDDVADSRIELSLLHIYDEVLGQRADPIELFERRQRAARAARRAREPLRLHHRPIQAVHCHAARTPQRLQRERVRRLLLCTKQAVGKA